MISYRNEAEESIMDFYEIQRQSAIAAKKQEVISVVKNGGDLLQSIALTYEVSPDDTNTYYVRRHSELYSKIKALIVDELEKENKQTELSLKNWVK